MGNQSKGKIWRHQHFVSNSRRSVKSIFFYVLSNICRILARGINVRSIKQKRTQNPLIFCSVLFEIQRQKEFSMMRVSLLQCFSIQVGQKKEMADATWDIIIKNWSHMGSRTKRFNSSLMKTVLEVCFLIVMKETCSTR